MFLLLQGVQSSCEVWVVLFVYSIFATNVRDLQSKFPVRHSETLGFPGNLVPWDYPTLGLRPQGDLFHMGVRLFL